jgi:hypothetical protein
MDNRRRKTTLRPGNSTIAIKKIRKRHDNNVEGAKY